MKKISILGVLWGFMVSLNAQVGLGTTSPSSELDIEGTGTTTGIDINNTSGSDFDPELRFQLSGTSIFTIGVDDSDSDKLKIGTTAVGTSTFVTLTSGGFMGIGTDAPAQLLEVVGTSNPTITVGESASVEGQIQWDHTNNVFNIQTISHTYPINIGNAWVYLEADGDVGMGTSTPSAELDIEGTGTTTAIDINNTSGSDFDPELRFQLSGTSAFTIGVDDSDSDKLKIGTTAVATSTRLTIDGSGNVGIGTDAPSQLLHVDEGSVQVTNPDNVHGVFVHGSSNSSTYSAIQFLETGTAHAGIRWDGQYLQFCEASSGADPDVWTAKMSYDISNNRMGIGVTAPNSALDVEASGATCAEFNRTSDDGTIISIQQDGVEEGTISSSGATISYNAFTGSHFGYSKDSFERGSLVSFTGKNKHFHGRKESEILYGIDYTQQENDPRVVGAYLSVLNPSDPFSVDNPHQVMAVGNGDMWVVDTGEDLKPGDYLISSSVQGHAMKDNGKHRVSYIVARVVEPVQWKKVKKTINGKKHYKVSVFFDIFEKENWGHEFERQQKEIDQLKKDVDLLKSQLLN